MTKQWKTVPVEPTPDMLKAMEAQWMCGSQIDMAKREYTAALAAAPQPSAEPVAWLYESPMPDGSVFVGASAERLQIGVGVTPDSKEHPLYTHPQLNDTALLKQALEALEIAEKHMAYVEFTEAIAALKERLK